MSQTLSADARPLPPALRKGLLQRCPRCGKGKLFSKFLKTVQHCESCGEAIHHHRADDAPPYFTMLIVGHIVVPALLLAEQWWAPPTWAHMVVWLPLSCLLVYLILPRVKGALVGLQWAWRMHGFAETDSDDRAAGPG